ncbi:hypothetical protein FHR83_009350 [Actinoplanes campanulatus]|uniref:Uncharacterized protein n=1 Tax=Actinoplanes campanulatus TaxID=113559 RepID=A0A7W5FKC0_9ACTN|nr:hypothetical protein [Actinoplanes campanulatus]MBB3101619.1 hypothetical protein [Actinoplanes campanulatus]GGN51702.1 hypothetical protein GCM10010109_92050 [Actinoplanes campanulatus]GID42681.1 hypothetical protein Aca09nite_91870 [Actinoplanes campanulatus]
MSRPDVSDTEQAARLVGLGLRGRQAPDRDLVYRDLVLRYQQDEVFAASVSAIADGLGLTVLDVTRRSGIVLAAQAGSAFEIRIDEYARQAKHRERPDTEKLLHGIAHLAVAALSFPRPDDLANDQYVGRVSVESVDLVVRETCRLLEERANRDSVNADPSAEEPELERAWRAYQRRHEVASTKDNRRNSDSTRGMVSRALRWLVERGLLQAMGEEGDEAFRTTSRYQIHVRQLASQAAFRELLDLGVVPPSTGGGLDIATDPQI